MGRRGSERGGEESTHDEKEERREERKLKYGELKFCVGERGLDAVPPLLARSISIAVLIVLFPFFFLCNAAGALSIIHSFANKLALSPKPRLLSY